MPWRLKIIDLEHRETHSSLMPADRAVALARDLIAAGSRVIGMVPTEGQALNEDEVKELCAGPTATTTWFDQQARLLVAYQGAYLTAVGHFLNLCFARHFDSREAQRSMGEIESRNGIAIDVGFGNITLCRDETGTYARAAVEITRLDHPADTLEMTLRVPASHYEPLAEIVERSRVHTLEMLRGAVDRLERETAETLIYSRG